tara:strand:- start:1721 stop:1957 length:237 start_codon:yes stop_codon:yes gene_type:complete
VYENAGVGSLGNELISLSMETAKVATIWIFQSDHLPNAHGRAIYRWHVFRFAHAVAIKLKRLFPGKIPRVPTFVRWID